MANNIFFEDEKLRLSQDKADLFNFDLPDIPKDQIENIKKVCVHKKAITYDLVVIANLSLVP